MLSNYNETLTNVIYNKLAELINSNNFQEALLLTTILRELRRSVDISSKVMPVSKPLLGSMKIYPPREEMHQLHAIYDKDLEQKLKQSNLKLQLQQPVEPSTYKWADGYVDPREDYWDK